MDSAGRKVIVCDNGTGVIILFILHYIFTLLHLLHCIFHFTKGEGQLFYYILSFLRVFHVLYSPIYCIHYCSSSELSLLKTKHTLDSQLLWITGKFKTHFFRQGKKSGNLRKFKIRKLDQKHMFSDFADFHTMTNNVQWVR